MWNVSIFTFQQLIDILFINYFEIEYCYMAQYSLELVM